jgi:hypothetical protein
MRSSSRMTRMRTTTMTDCRHCSRTRAHCSWCGAHVHRTTLMHGTCSVRCTQLQMVHAAETGPAARRLRDARTKVTEIAAELARRRGWLRASDQRYWEALSAEACCERDAAYGVWRSELDRIGDVVRSESDRRARYYRPRSGQSRSRRRKMRRGLQEIEWEAARSNAPALARGTRGCASR